MRSGLLELDPDSEEVILEVPKYEFDIDTERGGHCGGNLAWGPDGEELYLTTGDDTYWDASDFYTPIDEREGRAWNDAQRTSGNTNDLRGSVLRIRPTEGGGYDVPGDNLFTETNGYAEEIESGLVRPEIYAMGFRNPYRMAVDPETGVPYVADYGPDAGDWDPDRGPQGVTEYTRLGEPGFYGWPYFTGDAVPYRDYDFGTGESGDPFDPENPTNDSPNNDGLAELPPALGTQLVSPRDWERYLEYPSAWEPHMPYDALGEVPFPQVAGGSPMVATVYREAESHGSGGLSGCFDGKVFVMDRGRGWVKYLTYGEDADLVDVEPFLPGTEFRQPMGMAIGPEGALYVAEWGSGYEGPNGDSGIYRIERTAVDEPSIEVVGAAGDGIQAVAGETVSVETLLTNPLRARLTDGEITLAAGDDLSVSAVGEKTFNALAPNGAHGVTWEVSVPESAAGTYDLEITATYARADTGAGETVDRSVTLSVPEPVTAPFGVNAGGDAPVTVEGVTYVPTPNDAVRAFGDAGASGTGEAVSVSGTDSAIAGTDHDALYQSLQYGGDLSYEIAIGNGTYDVTLHLLENVHTSPGGRAFDVAVEGETVIEELDIYEEVGRNTALIGTVEGVEVTDGSLSIHTETRVDNTSICGVGVRPPGADHPS
jgi:hypothetical protein